MSFHYRGMECKSRKSRNTWSNRQVWPWRTDWSRAKAYRVLPRECTGSWQTPSSNNTREDSTHGHHQMVNTKIRLIIFFAAKKWRNSIQSAKTSPGADCGSDHELLIAKFRLKLKKVGKTTRPFRYDLNQIPYSGSDKLIQGIRSDRQSAWRTMEGGSWHCTGGY